MEEDNKIEHKTVQTYAEDMAEAIGSDTQGLVKKIIHEEDAHEEEKRSLSPELKRNQVFMIVGILLINFSLAIFAFFLFKKDTNTVPVEKQFIPVIFIDKSAFEEVSGFSKDKIIQTVVNEADTAVLKKNGIDGIYLTMNKDIVGLRSFLNLIKSSLQISPNTLLVSDNFLMGAVKNAADSAEADSGGFFILMKVRSTADIFDTMRTWENKMLTELHDFFGVNLSGETNYLFNKSFEDGIVGNKNARILYDKEGKIVLMYVYTDDNSVLITDSQAATREIMLRLASAQKKQ